MKTITYALRDTETQRYLNYNAHEKLWTKDHPEARRFQSPDDALGWINHSDHEDDSEYDNVWEQAMVEVSVWQVVTLID